MVKGLSPEFLRKVFYMGEMAPLSGENEDFTDVFDGNTRVYAVGSPGTSPPGSHRTVREALTSYGSSCLCKYQFA